MITGEQTHPLGSNLVTIQKQYLLDYLTKYSYAEAKAMFGITVLLKYNLASDADKFIELAKNGIIISNNQLGETEVQKIDNVKEFSIENILNFIPLELKNDKEANLVASILGIEEANPTTDVVNREKNKITVIARNRGHLNDLIRADRSDSLNYIDVSKITNMSFLFRNKENFNKDISDWDVSNVTDMGYMFNGATSFNQDISGWDVSKVTSMQSMFYKAESFNQDLKDWNVSNVTQMRFIFRDAFAFNQDINNWDVSKITEMEEIFKGAISFNGNIGNWDVSNVTNMFSVFKGATAFNQDISKWDVSNVTSMQSMFEGAKVFNQNISNWNISNVFTMQYMFKDATSFNQDINRWSVVNKVLFKNFNGCIVKNCILLDGMFEGASSMQVLPKWLEEEF